MGTLPTIAGSSTPITIYGTYSGLTTGDVYFILADIGGTVETIGEFVAGKVVVLLRNRRFAAWYLQLTPGRPPQFNFESLEGIYQG